MPLLRQQRRVGSHDHLVAVALKGRHICRLRQGIVPAVTPRGILPQVNLRPAPRILVVKRLVMYEPPRRLVIMLIHHLQLHLISNLPPLLIVGARTEGPHRTNHRDFRMLLADLRIEEPEPLLESVADQFFIADAQILQTERRRMARLSPHLPPGHRRIPIGKLDQIKHFLQIILHLLHGQPLLAIIPRILTAHGRRNHRHRLRPDILTKLKILIIAQSGRLVIIPDVALSFTPFHRPNGILPPVHVVQSVAMHQATPRKTQEPGLQIGHSLRQIGTQPVGSSFKGFLRKE